MAKADCFKVDELIDYGLNQYHYVLRDPEQRTQSYTASELAQAIRQHGTETPIDMAIIGALELRPNKIFQVRNW